MTEERQGRENHLVSEELAAFTDALLEGEVMDETERPPLAETVELLARTLEPEEPPERLRRNILRQIRAEWGKGHRAERRPLGQQVLDALRSLGWSRRRLVWAAAAALLVAALAVTLLLPKDVGGTTGTALGGPGMTALVAVLALVGLAAVVVWVVKREP